MDEERFQQVLDEIEDLKDENTTLKEAVDDLMGENERLRKLIRELQNKLGESSEIECQE